jgi:hypothetical protein
MGLVFACFLFLLAPPSSAQEIIKTCAGVEERAINVATETGRDWPLGTMAELQVVPQASTTPNVKGKTLAVIAYGPILGLVGNSLEVKTDLMCTSRGVTLGVYIMHLGDGADAAKNVLWRSKISLNLVLRQDVVFQTIWRMRRPNGKEIDHARTPPYPEQKYPITVTKTLHAAN